MSTFVYTVGEHSKAQIVNFRRWSSIPDVHFCPELRVLMVELNVFYKKISYLQPCQNPVYIVLYGPISLSFKKITALDPPLLK